MNLEKKFDFLDKMTRKFIDFKIYYKNSISFCRYDTEFSMQLYENNNYQDMVISKDQAIKIFKKRFIYDTFETEYKPNFNKDEVVNTFIIEDYNSFVKNLKKAFQFVERYGFYTSLRIEFRGIDFKIVSTNGKILFLYQTSQFTQSESEWYCNIPYITVYGLLFLFKDQKFDKVVFRKDNNNCIEIQVDDVSFYINNNNFDFPEYETVVNRDCVYKFKINKKEITKILKTIKIIAKNSDICNQESEYKILIDYAKNQITHFDSNYTEVIKIKSISGFYGGIIITNCMWLLECLKNVKNKEVTLCLEKFTPSPERDIISLKIKNGKTNYIVVAYRDKKY